MYKLTYFNFRARAETSRLLFVIAGVKYEDFRIDRTTWPESYRDETPFGQVPLLEVDGKVICQSRAIERYLAKQFGLAGKTDWDHARTDMIIECIEDIRIRVVAAFREEDQAKKAELLKQLEEKILPESFVRFGRILQENNDGDGHFVGKEVSLADVSFFVHTGTINEFTGITVDWDKWPKLKAVRENVGRLPKVAEWIKSRPVTIR